MQLASPNFLSKQFISSQDILLYSLFKINFEYIKLNGFDNHLFNRLYFLHIRGAMLLVLLALVTSAKS